MTTLGPDTLLPGISLGAKPYGFNDQGGQTFQRLQPCHGGTDATEIQVVPYSHDGTVVAHSIMLHRWRCTGSESSPHPAPYQAEPGQKQNEWPQAARGRATPMAIGDHDRGTAMRWKVSTELEMDHMMAQVEDWAVNEGKLPLQATVVLHLQCPLARAMTHLGAYFGVDPRDTPYKHGPSTCLVWVDNEADGNGSGLVLGELDFTPLSPKLTRVSARTSSWATLAGPSPGSKQVSAWKVNLEEALREDIDLATGALARPDPATVLGF